MPTDAIVTLGQASEEELDAIIETIESRVRNRVESAIRNGLTGWQKARVLLGTLNLDDIINSAFRSFPDLIAETFTFVFTAGSSQNYQIQGNLQVRPVPVDLCQAQVNAVKAAQAAVDGIESTIRALQDELKHGSPGHAFYYLGDQAYEGRGTPHCDRGT